MTDTIKEHKVKLLFKVVESITGIKKKELCGKVRKKEYAMPRNIIGYILNKELEINLMTSGGLIGRDHSTILYYTRVFDSNMRFYKEFRDLYLLVSETFWNQIMEADVEDITLEVKHLQNLINKLEEKKSKLINLTK